MRQTGDSGGDIYVKGAPECMKDICNEESCKFICANVDGLWLTMAKCPVPMDYQDLLDFYTHRGFRVIACAARHIQKLTTRMVHKIDRSEAETGLDLVGFIIFENKLKPSTESVIGRLNEAAIRSVMCTGDNVLTAISVARECSLIDRTAHCFIPHMVKGARPHRSQASCSDDQLVGVDGLEQRLKWHSVDNPLFELDEETLLVSALSMFEENTKMLKPLPPPAESDASLPYDVYNVQNYSLAVNGDAFRWIIEYGSEEMMQRVDVLNSKLKSWLTKGRCWSADKSSRECHQMKSMN